MMANTLALGAAFQRGLLPVSAGGARAGDPPERRRRREEPGRLRVGPRRGRPARTRSRARPPSPSRPAPELSERERELVDLARGRATGRRARARAASEMRVPELVAYQSAAYAAPLRRGRAPRAGGRAGAGARSRRAGRGGGPQPLQADGLQGRVRGRPPAPRRRSSGRELRRRARRGRAVWFNLHPPLLRALGLKRKLKLGRWFVPAFRMLRAMRRLRGTPLDPFGLAQGAARGAPADRRVRGARGRGARRASRPSTHATARGAVRAARPGPRLRGHQAARRRALFRERAAELRAELAPSVHQENASAAGSPPRSRSPRTESCPSHSSEIHTLPSAADLDVLRAAGRGSGARTRRRRSARAARRPCPPRGPWAPRPRCRAPRRRRRSAPSRLRRAGRPCACTARRRMCSSPTSPAKVGARSQDAVKW